ncbi:dihydrofolate reductase family protein [Sanguibacter sp. HDW7]|uniref:dihydrofolate reductase family protein n=1 Tax=Sanguibacter sp. HDW7 TaxID=2714931 RepID=UPI00140B25A8|nr:dihydrofolate reductase family protein [Sanguibacter sp. HDW7]QIK83492.1 deaminase [Sanguibacter sp. HDW7]
MGIVRAELFSTLDLVGQAPGGPDEDPVAFTFGGWQFPLLDDLTGEQLDAAYTGVDALLLGRRTYDIFAGYWPLQPSEGPDGTIAELFNRVPKYVVSRGRPLLDWEPTTLLGPDLTAEVDALRARHELVSVVGSLGMLGTLLRLRLVDEIDLWVHPILLGEGRTIFGTGTAPSRLELRADPVGSPKGVVLLQYRVIDGEPATGDMSVRA